MATITVFNVTVTVFDVTVTVTVTVTVFHVTVLLTTALVIAGAHRIAGVCLLAGVCQLAGVQARNMTAHRLKLLRIQDLRLGCLRMFDVLHLAKLPNPTVKVLSAGTASNKKSVTQLTVT
eukprot:1757183-Rhodomonas_salina.1